MGWEEKFKDSLGRYLTYLQMERGLAENTIISYRQELEKYHLFLKKQDLNFLNLDSNQILDFIKDHSRRGSALTSQAHLISTLKGFYKFLVIEGEIEYNPISDISTPKKVEGSAKIPDH